MEGNGRSCNSAKCRRLYFAHSLPTEINLKNSTLLQMVQTWSKRPFTDIPSFLCLHISLNLISATYNSQLLSQFSTSYIASLPLPLPLSDFLHKIVLQTKITLNFCHQSSVFSILLLMTSHWAVAQQTQTRTPISSFLFFITIARTELVW